MLRQQVLTVGCSLRVRVRQVLKNDHNIKTMLGSIVRPNR